jgi:GTPase Era involved in 16S rRNA processing
LSKIHEFIKQKSDDMTVGFQKIVETPIHLHVFKEHYIDLTLVDLPGIFYGDMTEMLIKNIWRRYVEEENTIILYVTPASNDLNTGEAFAIAKKADPEGLRTLTIATKIDTRERETFVEQFNSMKTGLGVVCVRCRTNNEVVNEKISFDELLVRERNALSEDDLQQLPTMAKGTPRLVE